MKTTSATLEVFKYDADEAKNGDRGCAQQKAKEPPTLINISRTIHGGRCPGQSSKNTNFMPQHGMISHTFEAANVSARDMGAHKPEVNPFGACGTSARNRQR